MSAPRPLLDELFVCVPAMRRQFEALEDALNAQEARTAEIRAEGQPTPASGSAPGRTWLVTDRLRAAVTVVAVAPDHCWVQAPHGLALSGEIYLEQVFGSRSAPVRTNRRFPFADGVLIELQRTLDPG